MNLWVGRFAGGLRREWDRRGSVSVRIVYPIGGFRLEAAAGSQPAILTLAIPCGFEVAFAPPPATVAQLHAALGADAPRTVGLQ